MLNRYSRGFSRPDPVSPLTSHQPTPDLSVRLTPPRDGRGPGIRRLARTSRPRVFLCHATPDRPFVESEILSLLSVHSVDFWYAPQDCYAVWMDSVIWGLESCSSFVLIMSPRSAESSYVRDEVAWAIDHRPNGLIPVLHKPCDRYRFHLKIPRYDYVDYRADRAGARRKLLDRIDRSGRDYRSPPWPR
jgi:hypothetical protein